MSKRLKASLHQAIVRAIMTDMYGKQKEAQRKALQETEFKVAEAVLKPYRKALDSLPQGFTGNKSNHITVRIKGALHNFEYKSASYNIDGYYSYQGKEPEDWYPTLSDSDPAYKAFKAEEVKMTVLTQEVQETEAQITSVIYGCTTVNKLLEVWPECAKFVPAEAGFNALIPLDTIKDLNKKLGLK